MLENFLTHVWSYLLGFLVWFLGPNITALLLLALIIAFVFVIVVWLAS